MVTEKTEVFPNATVKRWNCDASNDQVIFEGAADVGVMVLVDTANSDTVDVHIAVDPGFTTWIVYKSVTANAYFELPHCYAAVVTFSYASKVSFYGRFNH